MEITTMALTRLGEILHGEVVGRNECRRSVVLELDSGETAYLPARRMVTPFEKLTDGCEIRVLVVSERQDRSYRSTFVVSENLNDEVEYPEPEEGEVPAGEPSPELLRQYPAGKRVSGKVKGVRGDAILVLIDSHHALLPFSELGNCKPGSFRSGITVKAFVLMVDAGGLKLTKREPGQLNAA